MNEPEKLAFCTLDGAYRLFDTKNRSKWVGGLFGDEVLYNLNDIWIMCSNDVTTFGTPGDEYTDEQAIQWLVANRHRFPNSLKPLADKLTI